MTESLLVSTGGPTRILRLNRPAKRNALDDALLHALHVALAAAEGDATVRTIVLTGAGTGFCAGRDRRDVGGPDSASLRLQDESLDASVGAFTRVLMQLIDSPKPTIAAAHGFALAGGQALTLACDFVVAERGCRFGNPEMQYGFPAAMNTVLLARHLGRRKALEIAITGETYSTEEYAALGLINRLADPGTLDATTAAFAATLNALAPWSVRRTKELLRVAEESDMRSLMHAGDALNQLLRLGGQSGPLFRDKP